MRSVLEIEPLVDAPFAAVAVRRVPVDDEIIRWLSALQVPYGERVLIEYDAEGPTRIRTQTRGAWLRNDVSLRTPAGHQPGLRTVGADGITFVEDPRS